MRARFTVHEIAGAALRIVDEQGLAALSMRSLATALGTGPMTVYNYVADKAGLEELVVAAVVAEIPLPEPTDDWRHDVHAIAYAMWEGVRAHPAAVPLVLTRRMSSPTGFAIVDALVAALGRAGLTDTGLLAAFHGVFGFVIGGAQSTLAGPLTGSATEAADRIGSVAGAEHPHIAALAKVAITTPVEDDFARGLRMLIDGIACHVQP
ncbi:TetR/AcrR family transcriptional regulator [Mycolicibacterium fluoranthenivorans]|jgi:AcrR family transcriptional regulator|uniref:Transcriptional regulator, TetR family n=1 Tax=Mycolicibacterium fluoranthenivorans TaxID=258505 RepID=A0A1G4WZL4_9MYCO|nr:TetR/AcrR family transcriptional regulator C-terminal domain-containing protein [Mycolicibacterium fluoranthenivorans]SCX32964.1 transcriptional regulator, TetR family [Mycolicibacterium fluoranthenivorans]